MTTALNVLGMRRPAGERWTSRGLDAVLRAIHHDMLTGLPSREVFKAELITSVAEAPDPFEMCVLAVGVDAFSDVNRAFGTHVGDTVLTELSARLATLPTLGGSAARTGGDVFCVFARVRSAGAQSQQEDLVAEMLSVFEEPFVTADGRVVRVSGTVGVACGTRSPEGVGSLVHEAESAMQRAKAHRHAWASHDVELGTPSTSRLALAEELRAGLARHELEVWYQPVVDLRTGLPVSMEALVRWRHPVRGLVSPLDFVPLAEECGLIASITDFVVSSAGAEATQWRASGWAMGCAVNISARCLTDPGCSQRLLNSLTRLRADITVEITETMMLDPLARSALHRLVDAGVRVAIDDFGTGYSNLSSLKGVPAHTLKIARPLIQDIVNDQRDFDVAAGIVSLARSFGLALIAEGIESTEAASRLLEAGVTHGQGFFFARPMPAHELRDWLQSQYPRAA